ncbi:unnamed protein product [Prorocentrum cordatum]|uniref:non-specific serine/threonine protein kinase n=1 Tax=Prorocentrum cordatum TaxID=2364126 RepID=A0ABN9S333_9DINO|nr:unnamed protein product [Polarella glacialis]
MAESAVRARVEDASGWIVQRQLGRGQYGTAYLVEMGSRRPPAGGDRPKKLVEASLGDQAVAKVVGLEFLPEKEHSLAFQEVELMRNLKHPCIVMLTDHFLTEASLELVIVMDWCDGGDLRNEVKRRGKTTPADHIPEDQIMMWFIQLALALNYIHQRHILHRDLKSSNIFLITGQSQGYRVKIGDFGISRVLEGTVDVAATVVGTPFYMSPEVCKAEPYGYKSDIWALGCVLYEMCMLKHAFESQSLLGLVYKIVSETHPDIPVQYSDDLRKLLDRVLEKSQYDRPSGKEVMADPYVRRFVAGATADFSGILAEAAPPLGAPTEAWAPAEAASPKPPDGARAAAVADEGPAPVMDIPPGSPAAHAGLGGPQERPVRREWSDPPFVAAAPPSLTTEEGLRAKVLIGRMRRALTMRPQNWLQVFASFDQKGDGQLPSAEFERAVTSLALGLSDEEIQEVRASLQSGKSSCVPVDSFGAALHRVPPEARGPRSGANAC